MNRKPHSIWRTTTAAMSAVLLSAALPIAPIAADAQPEDRGQGPRPAAGGSRPAVLAPIAADTQPEDRGQGPRPAAGGSGPAVYVLDGRVVAIRRDPLPPGAYGGQGVDYSPDMTAWNLGPSCGR